MIVVLLVLILFAVGHQLGKLAEIFADGGDDTQVFGVVSVDDLVADEGVQAAPGGGILIAVVGFVDMPVGFG